MSSVDCWLWRLSSVSITEDWALLVRRTFIFLSKLWSDRFFIAMVQSWWWRSEARPADHEHFNRSHDLAWCFAVCLTVRSNGKTVKQMEKMTPASICYVSGATSPSWKVTLAMRNVHDQPESLRRRPTVVNLIRRSNSRPFYSHKFLTPDNSDVAPAVSLSPKISGGFRPFVWQRSCFNFDRGLSTPNSTLQVLKDQRLWFRSAVFN